MTEQNTTPEFTSGLPEGIDGPAHLKSAPAETPVAKPSRGAILNKASGIASARLKDAHIDEWNGYMAEEAKALGEQWSPRLSAEQRAEVELKALLDAHPNLKDRLDDIVG
jgi:hypothetical protein